MIMLSKRTILFLTLFIFTIHSYSQEIPNGNFDDWEDYGGWYYNPNQWITSNAQTTCSDVFRDPISYNGNYAMKVRTYGCFGWAQTSFQFDSTLHPLFLNCFVRTNIVGIDTVLIIIELLNDTNIVDYGSWTNSVSISAYSKITIPISQTNTTVNGARIYVKSGVNNATTINIDSLYFSGTNTSLSFNKVVNDLHWTVYPNPSSGAVFIKAYESQSNATVQAFDVSGRELPITTISIADGFKVETQEKGLIIITIKTDQGVLRKKVIFN